MHVILDDHPISPRQGFLIRKGPGNCFYDFAQELLFSDILRQIQHDDELSSRVNSHSPNDDSADDYIMSGNMPKGCILFYKHIEPVVS